MSAFTDALNRQSNLEFSPGQFLVVAKPYLSPKWGLFEDAATGDMSAAALAGTTSLGNLSKSGGYGLDNATTSNKIKTHGMAGPSRIIQSERNLTFTVEAQQTMRLTLELFFGTDLSGVTPSAKGGISFDIPDLPIGKSYKMAFIARDLSPVDGQPHYVAYKGNKVQVDKVKAIKGQDNDIVAYGIDLVPLTDDGASSPLTYEEFGLGWKPLNSVTDTGFFPVTSLTITPSSVSLAAAATQQLTVTDNNTFDRTAQATYSTSDPTKATVNAAGLVTAVASGSATITATYKGVSANKTVTVT